MKWLDSITASLKRVLPGQAAAIDKIQSEEALVSFLETADVPEPVNVEAVVALATERLQASLITVEAVTTSEAFASAVSAAVTTALTEKLGPAVTAALEPITTVQQTFTEEVNNKLTDVAQKLGVKLTETATPTPEGTGKVALTEKKEEGKEDSAVMNYADFFKPAGAVKVADIF